MGKLDKKRKKIEERIEFLENEMKTNLKQKFLIRLKYQYQII